MDLFYKVIDNFEQLKYALLEAQTFDPDHYGFPKVYYKVMETDKRRVGAYIKAFDHYDKLRDAVVCEAGIGTLALTQHYLPYVKKAYLIENNPQLTDFIKEELHKNGWTHKTEFIVGDAMKIELPEKVDYVIGELMSIYCANEYQVQIFKHLRQFLKPEGKLIPEKIINLAQAVNADFDQGHKHYPILFTRHWPELLSTQAMVNTTNLYREEALQIEAQTSLQPYLSGQANGILMHSLIELAEGVNFTGTDSLMPPTLMQLEEEFELKAGQEVDLHAHYHYGTNLDEARFWLTSKS
ncbi:MAG: methyltransferase domain-containing protein [Bacteroidota bacterium]